MEESGEGGRERKVDRSNHFYLTYFFFSHVMKQHLDDLEIKLRKPLVFVASRRALFCSHSENNMGYRGLSLPEVIFSVRSHSHPHGPNKRWTGCRTKWEDGTQSEERRRQENKGGFTVITSPHHPQKDIEDLRLTSVSPAHPL